MSDERYPDGTIVRTVRANNPSTDWLPFVRANCRWGVTGTVVDSYSGRGLCYSVEHDGGVRASYDHRELEVVSAASDDPTRCHYCDASRWDRVGDTTNSKSYVCGTTRHRRRGEGAWTWRQSDACRAALLQTELTDAKRERDEARFLVRATEGIVAQLCAACRKRLRPEPHLEAEDKRD